MINSPSKKVCLYSCRMGLSAEENKWFEALNLTMNELMLRSRMTWTLKEDTLEHISTLITHFDSLVTSLYECPYNIGLDLGALEPCELDIIGNLLSQLPNLEQLRLYHSSALLHDGFLNGLLNNRSIKFFCLNFIDENQLLHDANHATVPPIHWPIVFETLAKNKAICSINLAHLSYFSLDPLFICNFAQKKNTLNQLWLDNIFYDENGFNACVMELLGHSQLKELEVKGSKPTRLSFGLLHNLEVNQTLEKIILPYCPAVFGVSFLNLKQALQQNSTLKEVGIVDDSQHYYRLNLSHDLFFTWHQFNFEKGQSKAELESSLIKGAALSLQSPAPSLFSSSSSSLASPDSNVSEDKQSDRANPSPPVTYKWTYNDKASSIFHRKKTEANSWVFKAYTPD